MAQRYSPRGHDPRQVPRKAVRPRAAAGLSHDQILRGFASHHHLRARIIPPSVVPAPEQQLALDLAGAGAANDDPDATAESSPRPRRIGWASLLARVFAVDVTVCRKCGGRMRVLEVVSDPDDMARVLRGARAPPRPPSPWTGPAVRLTALRIAARSASRVPSPSFRAPETHASSRSVRARAGTVQNPPAPSRLRPLAPPVPARDARRLEHVMRYWPGMALVLTASPPDRVRLPP
jgi:hypothetical protein